MPHPGGDFLLFPDELLPLAAPLVSPLLVGARELRVTMQKPPHPPSQWRKDEGKEEEAHQEERDLRQNRNQDPDHTEDEEDDSPDDVPSLASRLAAPAFWKGTVRAGGEGLAKPVDSMSRGWNSRSTPRGPRHTDCSPRWVSTFVP